jgi:hypothetical protein
MDEAKRRWPPRKNMEGDAYVVVRLPEMGFVVCPIELDLDGRVFFRVVALSGGVSSQYAHVVLLGGVAGYEPIRLAMICGLATGMVGGGEIDVAKALGEAMALATAEKATLN